MSFAAQTIARPRQNNSKKKGLSRIAAKLSHKFADESVEFNRERLLNDILNTAVMGALVGGFALSQLQLEVYDEAPDALDIAVYMTGCVSVHACTCSCLTSALLYRATNKLPDEACAGWAKDHPILLMMPLAKFGMGCISYLLSVICFSLRSLQLAPFWMWASFGVGVMSMSTVFATVAILSWPHIKEQLPDSPMNFLSDSGAGPAARVSNQNILSEPGIGTAAHVSSQNI